MSLHAVVLALLVAVPLLALVVMYNKLVSLRLRIKECWSNVDTELKRRRDLVPNLVRTVQAYAAHEKDLMEELTRLRAAPQPAADDARERADAEGRLGAALDRLMAVAEAYPTLRAAESFLSLQRRLAETEDRIQAARRFYNANVRDYNDRVETFPSNLVAKAFRFTTHPYFELADARERAAPAVG